MKKLVIAFSTIAILASCATRNSESTETVAPAGNMAVPAANATPANLPDPTTVQLIDSVYDFGTVQDGAVVQFSYRFKNTGTKPLVIMNASASCGCTVPEKPEQPIMPGETGYIKVKFDSKGRVGEAHKTVHVESNAQPQFPELLLKGNVKAVGS